MVTALSRSSQISAITAAVRRTQDRCRNDQVERLKALPRAMFSTEVFTEINRGAFLTFWHEIRFNPAVRAANREIYKDYYAEVKQIFCLAAKQAGSDLDADSASLGLIAMIDGLWLELSIDDNIITRKKAVKLCTGFIDQQLSISN